MTTAVFDTLKASDTLKAAGIEAKQAEAIVHTMAGAFEDTVATRSDVAAVRSDLKTEIGAVRADMDKLESSVKTDIAEVKASLKADIAVVRADMDKLEASIRGDIKLLKWMIGVILACVAFPILKSFLA